jgi:hypothetical protein
MRRAEDNKFLTESGSGTPMGDLLRRFWLPVLLSEELPDADGPPRKIVMMGEELLAFRDRHERRAGMRWTRVVLLTRALSCGRRSRVVLTPQWLASSWR